MRVTLLFLAIALTTLPADARIIGMSCLQQDLRLEIDDYSSVPELRDSVKIYNALLTEHVERQSSPIFVHSARG